MTNENETIERFQMTNNLNIPTLDNVKVKFLRKNGYNNILEWLDNENNVYIGRRMRICVKRDTYKGQKSNDKYIIYDKDKSKPLLLVIIKKSIWHNPINNKIMLKYGRDKGIEFYKKYLLNDGTLINELDEKEYGKLPKINLLNKLNELNEKNLGCWCAPSFCHGHIIQSLFR